MPGTGAAEAASASDEVIDAIAEIEMRRREAEKEAGLAGSCGAALRKLHELLDLEKESLQLSGREAGNPGNVEAVTIEIERVKGLAVVTVPRPVGRSPYPDARKSQWRDANRSPSRNKGRRTMGRAGGR
jgi:hypothetical protein